MDFALLQPNPRYRFLRDIVAIKWRWMYYAIMVLDPILRFGWIFYAIFTHDAQHSTIVSFLVAFSEIIRRGMWALFRVENEHCANVAQYKASRDVPLPYRLEQEPLTQRVSTDNDEASSLRQAATAASTAPTTTASGAGGLANIRSTDGAGEPRTDEPSEAGVGTATGRDSGGRVGGMRRRMSELTRANSIRNIIASAHRQDFQKKRRSREDSAPPHGGLNAQGEFVNPSDDEEEDDEDGDESGSASNERLEIRRVEGLVRDESSGCA